MSLIVKLAVVQPFPLMRLPPEIRIMVYKEILIQVSGLKRFPFFVSIKRSLRPRVGRLRGRGFLVYLSHLLLGSAKSIPADS